MGRSEALALAGQADELYVAKGASVLHVDLARSRPSDDEIVDLMLGPTGNLRAPTVRRGRTLIVGFDEQSYKSVAGLIASRR